MCMWRSHKHIALLRTLKETIKSIHNSTLAIQMVKDSLPVTRRFDLEVDCELLWLELFSQSGPILFATFYRPPNSDVTTLNSLNHSLSSIQPKYPIILCGDFNLPQIDWSTVTPGISSPVSTLLCSIVNDNFLTQMVNFPTRQDNILDLILVRY